MRRKDAVVIAFFCGAITIIVFMIITLLSIPDSGLEKQLRRTEDQLMSSIPTFRFLFMLTFILAASGVVIRYLRIYHINYMYIFELDPAYKITHAQLFKVSPLHISFPVSRWLQSSSWSGHFALCAKLSWSNWNCSLRRQ
jgi:hypothetical protein